MPIGCSSIDETRSRLRTEKIFGLKVIESRTNKDAKDVGSQKIGSVSTQPGTFLRSGMTVSMEESPSLQGGEDINLTGL
jgi:hypothetical protein